MKNFSRQREAVLKVLKNTKSHPTATQVYEEVKKTIPNISLGTVYRNLSELYENGDIIKVAVGDGFEHFDADTSSHIHLRCKKCGSITDVYTTLDVGYELASETGFTPERSVCTVYGICKNCRQKQD